MINFNLGDLVIVEGMDGKLIRRGIVTSKYLNYILVEEEGIKTSLSAMSGSSYDVNGHGKIYTIKKLERP